MLLSYIRKPITQIFLALLLALELSLLISNSALCAYADEIDEGQAAIDEAQSNLDDATAKMETIASDYDTLQKQVDELQTQIDNYADKAAAAQSDITAGREKLGKIAKTWYQSSDIEAALSLLFSSKNITDVFSTLDYLGFLSQSQNDAIKEQQQRLDDYQKTLDSLNSTKNVQDTKLKEIEEKRAEAQKLVDSSSAALVDANASQAERIAALKAMAESMMQSEEGQAAGTNENWDTYARPADVEGVGEVKPNPDPVPATDSNTTANSNESIPETPAQTTDPSAGWQTGIASAYGGSSDPITPNPGITATGAVCDDWSMGVAVPMAWPRYWQYYNRRVEISWGGMTVIATVNDCGGMGGGSRSLDLQPGVWKAFGAKDCFDWGLRQVNYRFL